MSSIDHPACERCLQDAAAYVLGALPERECESYREHLAGCAECVGEVAALQAAADSLALAVTPMQTPEEVRTRVMAVVGGEAELLRAAGHEADRPPRARTRWRTRLAPALAAGVALAAGLVIGAIVLGGGSGAGTRTQTIQAAVSMPGSRVSAQLRKAGSHVELVVAHMPAPALGRIYEVWVERGARAPQPTDALFSVTGSGSGSVGVPGDLAGVSRVLVTSEPLGGSLKPTRPPVIVASM
jgi:hypothetical protein